MHAVLIYTLCQHKQPSCKHTAMSTMSNNSVSIRSPLSCVRGLHANRCPRLMLTSYSWLAAIKSINENINTNFSTSLSPTSRLRKGITFQVVCVNELAALNQLAPVLHSLFTEQRVQRHTEHGGRRGSDKPRACPACPVNPPATRSPVLLLTARRKEGNIY